MSFALIAEFPGGVYQGHVASGDLDPLPSATRLHAALLCAAGAGVRAVITNGRLAPRADDAQALRWLENNPPDGLMVPGTVENRPGAIAYRDLGLFDKRQKGVVRRKQDKTTVRVAVAGPVAWVWDHAPPAQVLESLQALCRDVSHLGMAESPVRLSVGDAAATHRRAPTANLFVGDGLNVEVPTHGRMNELVSEHDKLLLQPRKDGTTTKEYERSGPPPCDAVGTARYVPLSNPVKGPMPWSHAWLVPLDAEVGPDWRTRWAIAAHRALISLAGDGAPPVLTGRYSEAAAVPANRVSIQFLGHQRLASGDLGTPGSMLVLIPTGTTSTDLEVIEAAVSQLRRLQGPGNRFARRIGSAYPFDTKQFWAAPPEGTYRRWLTVPAAVPDGRPPTRKSWTMDDAVSLSVAMVWRDILNLSRHQQHWQVAWAAEARNQGVKVEALHWVTDGDLSRFVHRVNPGAVVRPYQALLDLGDLGTSQGLVAIGQSRHLGGGLLYPVDIPSGEV
jgi:CRISPR-associated protein Csb2